MNKFMIMLLVLFVTSCGFSWDSHKSFKKRCVKRCIKMQESNVGTKISYPNTSDFTFARCICYDKDGETKSFLMRRKNVR